MAFVISVEEVSLRLGRRTVVDQASFSVGPGEIVVVAGENGAGKTMLLRLLLGLVRPTAGSILFDDRSTGSSRSSGAPAIYGTVGQPAFYEWRSAQANVAMAVVTRRARPSRSPREVLDAVHLSDPRRAMRKRSMGERQRVNMAIALLVEPTVLVLDEPTNGLDAGAVQTFLGHLRQISEQGRSAIVATHQVTELEAVATRCVVMHQGRIIDDAPAERWRATGLAPHYLDAWSREGTRS